MQGKRWSCWLLLFSLFCVLATGGCGGGGGDDNGSSSGGGGGGSSTPAGLTNINGTWSVVSASLTISNDLAGIIQHATYADTKAPFNLTITQNGNDMYNPALNGLYSISATGSEVVGGGITGHGGILADFVLDDVPSTPMPIQITLGLEAYKYLGAGVYEATSDNYGGTIPSSVSYFRYTYTLLDHSTLRLQDHSVSYVTSGTPNTTEDMEVFFTRQ